MVHSQTLCGLRCSISRSLAFLRRQPLATRVGGISGLVLCGLLASCDKPASSGSADSPSVPNPPSEQKVVVINFDQYFDPSVLEKFTARTGVAVEVKTIDSTDEMQQLLRAAPQSYDVIITEESAIQDLRERRLLYPLDKAKLPHLAANIDPQYLNPACDPGSIYSVPYLWGTTLIAYRKDRFPTPPQESVALLFDPSVKGKISLLDERNEVYMMMLLKLGVMPATAGADNFGAASELLNELIVKREARFGSDNEMKEHLLSGESSVAMMYSGDAALIAQENPNIAYFIPQEGATIWVDFFAIPRDTPRPELAHQFIDFLTEKENAAASSNLLRYASPNREATPLLDPVLLKDPTIYPANEVRQRCSAMPAWTIEQQRAMNGQWKSAHEAVGARIASPDPTIPKPTNPTAAPETNKSLSTVPPP